MADVTVYAHRGAAGIRPENTMPAFLEALKVGADGIETDVHLSRDCRLVLCHDEKLERTTNGRGLIFAHTWEELKTLDAGVWFAQAFAGTRLPLLDELLQATPLIIAAEPEIRNLKGGSSCALIIRRRSSLV